MKEEKERFEQASQWVASIQKDLTQRFEVFKLGSAFCMVGEEAPASFILPGMLLDLKTRDFGEWQGKHLEKIIAHGPELAHDILVKYMEMLPKYLTKKPCTTVKDAFISAIKDVANTMATYRPPMICNDIDRARVLEELKDLLEIRFADGAEWVEEVEEPAEGEQEHASTAGALCDHPGCLEHVEDKAAHGMI